MQISIDLTSADCKCVMRYLGVQLGKSNQKLRLAIFFNYFWSAKNWECGASSIFLVRDCGSEALCEVFLWITVNDLTSF